MFENVGFVLECCREGVRMISKSTPSSSLHHQQTAREVFVKRPEQPSLL